jgi:hypothetical protein
MVPSVAVVETDAFRMKRSMMKPSAAGDLRWKGPKSMKLLRRSSENRHICMLACAAIEEAIGGFRREADIELLPSSSLCPHCRSIAEVGSLIARIRDRAWLFDDVAIDALVAALGFVRGEQFQRVRLSRRAVDSVCVVLRSLGDELLLR